MTFYSSFVKSKHFKYGLPFFCLVIGGSFGLRQFSSIRYDFRKRETLNPAEIEKAGLQMKKQGEVTLETEFEKVKTIDIDNWENIRGPRLWDETPPTYDED